MRFGLQSDGAVRDLSTFDATFSEGPAAVKAAAEQAVRGCAPYPASRGGRDYIIELQ